jgi:NDP-sugar pyrophosphorylase family protein
MVPALDALILCGGLGTRLRPVLAGRPKGLAQIRGRPFLDVLVARLLRRGLTRFIFCAGYGADQIAAHYARRDDAEFVMSLEERPLGTGGAVRQALPLLRSDPFFVMNGDSFCDVDYEALYRFHLQKRAALSIVVVPPGTRDDVGTIALNQDHSVARFS